MEREENGENYFTNKFRLRDDLKYTDYKVNIYMYVYIYMYLYLFMYIYAYIYIYICIYENVVYICIYI
jgi:hypothetical protein